MVDPNATVLNLRHRSVLKTVNLQRHRTSKLSPESGSVTETTESELTPRTPENADPLESDLVDNFVRLDCKDSPTVPPPNYREIFLNSQLGEKQGKSDFPTRIPVLKPSSLYPINELEEMAECREVSFSRDSEADKTKKPEEDSSGFITAPNFDRKSTPTEISFDPQAFAEILERTLKQPVPRTAISDSVLAPKTFNGTAAEDPEAWLDYFERYIKYRNIPDGEKRTLFSMFMREGAANWLSTLTEYTLRSYESLKKAFQENFFKSRELLWKEAGDLFNQMQRPEERVDDFVTRLKRCARRLNITDDTFHHAVLHGLRGPIRLHVLQQGVRDLQQTLRAARIAEASTSADPLTSLLLETIKTTTNMAEKQAADIKELSAKVSALATSNNGTVAPVAYAENAQLVTNAVSRNDKPAFGDNRRKDNFRPRVVKQTPQNIQRANYARQTANRKSVIQTSFRQPQTASYDCRNCGLHHQRGECKAFGQTCNHCGKIGHFARVCRANKTTTQ
jgi:hypothetical protein